jgi:hypothetical protein
MLDLHMLDLEARAASTHRCTAALAGRCTKVALALD